MPSYALEDTSKHEDLCSFSCPGDRAAVQLASEKTGAKLVVAEGSAPHSRYELRRHDKEAGLSTPIHLTEVSE